VPQVTLEPVLRSQLDVGKRVQSKTDFWILSTVKIWIQTKDIL